MADRRERPLAGRPGCYFMMWGFLLTVGWLLLLWGLEFSISVRTGDHVIPSDEPARSLLAGGPILAVWIWAVTSHLRYQSRRDDDQEPEPQNDERDWEA